MSALTKCKALILFVLTQTNLSLDASIHVQVLCMLSVTPVFPSPREQALLLLLSQ